MILHALNRGDAVTRYCEDGYLETGNVRGELALRGVVIGRRNCQCAGLRILGCDVGCQAIFRSRE
ncbi:IS66 family transposase [Burkholderia metallica]|nr:IS66 family transposase [Burkholderia metallica]